MMNHLPPYMKYVARNLLSSAVLVGAVMGVAVAVHRQAIGLDVDPGSAVILGAAVVLVAGEVSTRLGGHHEGCQTCGWSRRLCDCQAHPEQYEEVTD